MLPKNTSFLYLLGFCVLIAFGCSDQINKIQNSKTAKTGTVDSDFKILVISDLNSSYGSTTYGSEVHSVIARIPKINPNLIIVPGDMIAGQKSSLSNDNMAAMWASFDSTIFNPIRQNKVPFAFTFGNHDASPGFIRDRKMAGDFWNNKKSETGLIYHDASHYPFYFSYVHNNIFFISWDAAAAKIDSEVYEWMGKVLQSPLAKSARIRILTGHLPLFAIVESKNKPGEVLAEPLQALNFFKANDVNLYISGHQHAYYPAQKDGINFLNSGCVGDGPRPLMGSEHPPLKTYTIINVPSKNFGKFSYKTYSALNHTLINQENLPDSIVGFNGISYLEQ